MATTIAALCAEAEQRKMAITCPCYSFAFCAYALPEQILNGAPHRHPVEAFTLVDPWQALRHTFAYHGMDATLVGYIYDVIAHFQRGGLLPMPALRADEK